MNKGEGRAFLDNKDTSSTLFSRSMIEVYTFDDFTIRKIIGKGTFGKVRKKLYNLIGLLSRKY